MFSKILIANRGEIACRIIKTARRMGIKTVAVYAEADAQAQHVKLADEAVFIGPSPASESYLVGQKIIDAAKATGAEAIHPGYGFLSENPDFVEAVEKAGLTFIGPKAHSIRSMGLKDAAKRLMEEAGVPVVPGYHGDNQDAAFLAGQADEIGYPVLIKASAGGGGKGMRRVDKAADFISSLDSCRREAKSAFGDDRVLIEKYVLSPRHIEVQVFGDSHGNIVHLFERDCSLQRRHQKVIEEAPAPGMSEPVRSAMTRAAIKAAEAVNYQGAGTIEFIVDGSGPLRADGFWFMEMNTRLQVEHPVTEAITGFDLVEWQLRVAAGEALPVKQGSIAIHGHAAEARLYAEDPAAGFLPQAGHIDSLEFGLGDGVRIDGGVVSGDQVSPFYDPMIAKVIAHGPGRQDALGRLQEALDNTLVSGLTTNRDFLRALVGNDTFRAGRMDTGLIDRNLERLIEKPEPSEIAIAIAAVIASRIEPSSAHLGFRLWGAADHRIKLLFNGEMIERGLRLQDGVISLHGGNQSLQLADILMGESFEAKAHLGNRSVRVRAKICATEKAGFLDVSILLDGQTFVFTRPDPVAGDAALHSSSNDVLAPMTGVVRMVLVSAGDVVSAGERLAVMEAMKMEHTLTAPRDGEVQDVLCAEGDPVEGGAVLIRLKEEE
ncbi:acetyl/propionyl/methylcrotonyl-CoA carboxylase subunit alpha [Rhizobium sp. L1K21]|uniref:acetyl/propionyl/methylcrotonyl-CoA carboxylase subunit alpha n=1 Tax=Rhizobium sp. L1K21 TaxID=2954933 RepID=UPI0020925370|nr:acetyl/propionyl/methylcrotonyl-CoA carboxylase subunit alpha [Rhizobium sp. L1K21]MCO6187455.1 acetyl/propionyl/methylcrotonyl-CoA carboxylase subunit alpha [Rhizobium sp. L1K21]